ncbi:CAP domain-containing protein [Novosphingobium mangrovi (ex Hu et al. 2023)]|uniref:CAP domain-containing protein n=1 Tax=Novosphingobium mangrovi (ex Hu et al. 2023) TaxID=2930094 RepID=A0ABT0AGG9_9SPHN|nr:CAP domain-containing protein [Novosphingobium mangrovi (ex Hu et al. 2023)]MCJ1962289.1 CAP domain-containing protein [Novosphingobium mangrovi (ex Hu et al. 2023)]
MGLGILAAAAMAATGSGSVTGGAPDRTGFADTVLAIHNQERAAVGAAPLRWSPRLAREAQTWAHRLAASGTFSHDTANRDTGENLWMGTRGAYRVADMVAGWAREKTALHARTSWQANFPRVGHYTQMIWARTSAVGCALAQSARHEYLVCRYDPPGNVWNESPYTTKELASNRQFGAPRARE